MKKGQEKRGETKKHMREREKRGCGKCRWTINQFERKHQLVAGDNCLDRRKEGEKAGSHACGRKGEEGGIGDRTTSRKECWSRRSLGIRRTTEGKKEEEGGQLSMKSIMAFEGRGGGADPLTGVNSRETTNTSRK